MQSLRKRNIRKLLLMYKNYSLSKNKAVVFIAGLHVDFLCGPPKCGQYKRRAVPCVSSCTCSAESGDSAAGRGVMG